VNCTITVTGLLLLAFTGSAVADCGAKIEVTWASAKKYNLTLAAHAVGPNCASSAVVLLVMDSKRDVQWSTTRLAQQNAIFMEGITDDASMTAALKTWVEQDQPLSTSELPDWKAGAEQPEREGDREFGFFIGPETSREFYLETRRNNQPLFCFVQGVESTSCITATGSNSIYEIGGFTFPG
jgi:hypothetical protein